MAKRRPKRQKEARGARLRYQVQLTDMRKTLEELIRARVIPKLEGWAGRRGDALRHDNAGEISRVFEGLTLVFARAHPDAELDRTTRQVAADVDATSAAEWNGQMKAALGVEIISEPVLAPVFEAFVTENQSLVKTLFGEQLELMKQITLDGIANGIRVGTIRDELMARLGVVKSRAALIARDQTLKLAGNLTEVRQKSVGVTEYIWDTSQDERVRPAPGTKGTANHRRLHGTRQKWSEPPIVDTRGPRREHPGGDYQCRCQALPVFPDDLLTA